MGLKHWSMTGAAPADYEMGTADETFEGEPAAYLRSTVKPANAFGAFAQTIAADEYRAKRVRFSGALKSSEVTGWAGLWLRVDGASLGDTLAIDNMENRGLTDTTGWRREAIVLDVVAAADSIWFGAVLSGEGQLLVSGLAFEEVGMDVPVTWPDPNRPRHPKNLDFSQT